MSRESVMHLRVWAIDLPVSQMLLLPVMVDSSLQTEVRWLPPPFWKVTYRR